MNNDQPRALLLVISSPSGGGKTTLCARLLQDFKTMVPSISCTTRAPRMGEKEGRDYYFLNEDEFRRRIKTGYFLEYAQVHDHWYGTPRQPVVEALTTGHDIVMAIDVQGAARIRDLISHEPNGLLYQAFVDVFILPPNEEVLRQRLIGRGQDSPETIERRLRNAEQELRCQSAFRYVIINDQLDTAYQQLRMIVLQEQRRLMGGGKE